MAVAKHVLSFSCAALLALGACTNVKHVPVAVPGAVGQAALDREEQRTADQKARADALDAALADLRTAQAALGAAGGTAGQRMAALNTVTEAQESIDEVRTGLTALPASAARTSAVGAVDAVDAALEAVAAALGAVAAVTAAAGSGAATPANAHTDLARAQTALEDARQKLTTALAADPTPDIRNLLSQAQGLLSAAQISLVPALNRELDRLTMRFGKDLAIDGREASRAAPAANSAVTLTPRRAGVEWTANTGFAATSPSWSIRTRYTVTDYGTASTARLDIERDPVAWTAGAGMVIPGASGAPATTEFPGRGQVFRGIGYDHVDFQLARQGSYGETSGVTRIEQPTRSGPARAIRGNMRGHAVSSFRYDAESGLTMKFGGLPPDQAPAGAPEASKGSLIYGDLEALTAKGTYNCGPSGDMACDEAGTRDLTVSFGDPSRDLLGEPNFYWTVDVDDPRLTIAAGATATAANPATRADADGVVGVYEMLLSNHAGVDDKGTPAAGDDAERYLRYAAYGLFQFVDYQTHSARTGRMQTLHYGFDAFGTHNPLPAATADSIAATLEGRTMAWLAGNSGNVGEAKVTVGDLHRMRGNVTLHACIGGSGCQAGAFTAPAGAAKPTAANQLRGAIHDLEIQAPAGGSWSRGATGGHRSGYYAFLGDILLSGAIDANGAFSGTANPDTALSDSQRIAGDRNTRNPGPDTHGYTRRAQDPTLSGNTPTAMDEYWRPGRFEGAFYGPANALEAAGTYWVPSTVAERDAGVLGLIGSFGVKAPAAGD